MAHWDDKLSSFKEVLDSISCFLWSHAELISDRQNNVRRFILIIYNFHVVKERGITCVVNDHVRVHEGNDKAACFSTCKHSILIFSGLTTRGVVCMDHSYFAPRFFFWEREWSAFVKSLDVVQRCCFITFYTGDISREKFCQFTNANNFAFILIRFINKLNCVFSGFFMSMRD